MPFALAAFFPIAAAYLLGAVPFGLLIARTRDVDIRTVGSGNIGATNVWRCVGRTWGAIVYTLDMAKGTIAVALIPKLFADLAGGDAGLAVRLACGLFVVVGHNWPIYLHFRGGKGIATTAGVLLGVAPAAMGIGIATWILVFVVVRYVSLASIVAAVAVGTSSWFVYRENNVLCGALTLLAGFAIWRHHTNIARLLKGNEHRFSFWGKGKSR